MALVASTSQRGKTRKSLGRLSPKIPPSRACNAFCQWSVRGKDQIRELPPSASEASYHEACPSAKTPLAWILIYFGGLDFKHWLDQQTLPIWNKAFLSKGAIHPWAGGCGRKAQQSPLRRDSPSEWSWPSLAAAEAVKVDSRERYRLSWQATPQCVTTGRSLFLQKWHTLGKDNQF